jgi:hypothetical protein
MSGRLSLCTVGLCALLSSAAGCGKTEADVLIPVEGQVRYAGKPLTTGVVVLYPDTTKGNSTQHEPRGQIGEDGRYQVATHPRVGAPPGSYRVGVTATAPPDPSNPYAPPRTLIPERYGKPDQSGLSLEVRAGAAPGTYDVDLK